MRVYIENNGLGGYRMIVLERLRRVILVCGLAAVLGGCTHNLVETVREGETPNNWRYDAFLLVGIGGEADGEVLGETVHPIDGTLSKTAYFDFSEYDPNNPRFVPTCWSLTWNHSGFSVPLKENKKKAYELFKVPADTYGFSDGHYSRFERGKVTYIGDYVPAGRQKCGDPLWDSRGGCAKVIRINNPQPAREILNRYGLPTEALVTSEDRFGDRLVKRVICSP